jgi:broad specificity phosphatase PhoE
VLNPQLVVVSPLQRAIQTALLSFAHAKETCPWVAHEGCREELGLLVCNKRRPLSEIQQDFSHIDFSAIQSEPDDLFHDTRRETLLEQLQRAYEFLSEYIRNRPESEIAIVGHSAWLFTALNAVVDCGDDDSLTSWFLTSEIRSMRVTFSDKDI